MDEKVTEIMELITRFKRVAPFMHVRAHLNPTKQCPLNTVFVMKLAKFHELGDQLSGRSRFLGAIERRDQDDYGVAIHPDTLAAVRQEINAQTNFGDLTDDMIARIIVAGSGAL